MKKLMLLYMLLIAVYANAQTTISLGVPTGAGSTNVLLSTSTTTNLYSKTISLYKASEIITQGGFGGNIISLAWDKQGTGEYTFGDAQIRVYLKHVAANDWTTVPDWTTEVATATQVFTSNTYSIPTGTGWKTVTFSSPFTWNGGSNIAVFVEWYRPSAPTADISWGRSTNTDCNATRVGGSLPLSALGVNDNRPLLQLTFVPNAPCTSPPTAGTSTSSSPSVCAGAPVNLNLAGNSTGSGQNYQWQSSTTLTGTYTNMGSANSSALLTINPTSTLFYRCAVKCGTSTENSVPIQIPVTQGISGTYTINKGAPPSTTNFQSFAAAKAALACGINGPLVFNVVTGSGPYNEQLTLTPVLGVSSTNTITFNGNGNTLTYNTPATGDRAVVKLDGADYITFNNLVVDPTGATYGYGFQLLNDADNNTINGCTVENDPNGTAAGLAGICITPAATSTPTSTGDSKCDNNVFSNNIIKGGANGITMCGTTSNLIQNNKVLNNTILDVYDNNIYLYGNNNVLVQGNDISRPNRTSHATSYGIYIVTSGTNNKINANRIHNMFDAAPTSTSVMYYYASSADGTAGNENVFSNNIAYNMNGNGTQYGLYNATAPYTKYVFNTISSDNTASTAGITYGIYKSGSSVNVEFINNLISITRGGSANKYGIYLVTATSPITANYNCYYINAASGNVGYKTSAQSTLSLWQTASGVDGNSIEAINPLFTSASTGNLLPTASGVQDLGTPIAGITTDILNALRSPTNPDMGAFEGLYCAPPTGLNAAGITTSSANLTWNTIGGAVGYEYAVTTSATPPASGTATIPALYNATGLIDNTNYYLHVRTKCGATSFSAWASKLFTTLTCMPVATPTINGVTYTSANISWTTVGGSLGYEYAVTTSATPPASGTSTAALTYNPSTLIQGTNYYVHLRNKCDAVNFSDWTTTPFTTTACPAVATPTVTNITAVDADIEWIVVPGVLGYEYAVTTSATPPASGTFTTSTTQNAPGLSPSTNYYVHVRSQCTAAPVFSAWVTKPFTTTPPCALPTPVTVNNITYLSADVNWTLVPSAADYQYAITISATPPASGTVTTATSYSTTGLAQGTTYYAHIRSRCPVGGFSPWTTKTFTTLMCNMPVVSISNISISSADISWVAIPGTLGYEYEISTNPLPSASPLFTTGTSYNPTALTANTLYYFHVRNKCTATDFSAWRTVSFLTYDFCTQPSTPIVSNITTNGATINWSTVAGATGYQYEVSTSATPPASGTLTANNFYTASGLIQGTTYYIHVRTRCNPIGNYSLWTTTTFNTPLCVTPAVPIISNISYSSATINWAPVSSTWGYEYEISTSATPPSAGTYTVATMLTPTGLTGGTTYYVHVRNKCGTNTYSGWTTATFNTMLCAAPQGLSVSNIGYTGATVNWSVLNGAEGYEYVVNLFSSSPSSGTGTTNTSANVNSLQSNTTYYVHVRSKCSSNTYSTWSTTSFVTASCVAPNTVTVSDITPSHATISWLPVSDAVSYQYLVSINGLPITTGTSITATSFDKAGLTPGTTYFVHLKSVCTGNIASDWSSSVFKTFDPTAISFVNGEGQSLEIYPNPVKEVLTVIIPGKHSEGKLLLQDVTGKILNSLDVKTDKLQINMSQYAQGMYLLKYVHSTGSSTIKFSKD